MQGKFWNIYVKPEAEQYWNTFALVAHFYIQLVLFIPYAIFEEAKELLPVKVVEIASRRDVAQDLAIFLSLD